MAEGGGWERSFPTAARGADYYHFWARSLPVQRPSPNRSARSDSTAFPPSPPPSFSFFLLLRAGTSTRELRRGTAGAEERRGGPAAASGSTPPTEAAFISADEPYGARGGCGGRWGGGGLGWKGGGLGWKGGVLLGEPDNKELTSRQEAICATQINFTAPGSVRGAAST